MGMVCSKERILEPVKGRGWNGVRGWEVPFNAMCLYLLIFPFFFIIAFLFVPSSNRNFYLE